MRVRVFLEGDEDHGGLADYTTDFLPSVGDILTLRIADEETAYRVTARMLRVDPRGERNQEDTFHVGVKVREVGSVGASLVSLM